MNDQTGKSGKWKAAKMSRQRTFDFGATTGRKEGKSSKGIASQSEAAGKHRQATVWNPATSGQSHSHSLWHIVLV